VAAQRITSAFATAGITADVLGVPRARTRSLIDLAKQTLASAASGIKLRSTSREKSHASKAPASRTRKKAHRP